jgi:UDP-N-acetylmuramyl pentapeptide synthase
LNPIFLIKIRNGEVAKISGSVKNSFLTDCREIAKRNEIESGLIYAVTGSFGKTVVNAGGRVSKEILQQLRNTWNF